MAKTRLQHPSRSRKTKKPMTKATFTTATGAISYTKVIARKPKLDKKGYPAYKGLPAPTLVDVTVVTP